MGHYFKYTWVRLAVEVLEGDIKEEKNFSNEVATNESNSASEIRAELNLGNNVWLNSSATGENLHKGLCLKGSEQRRVQGLN